MVESTEEEEYKSCPVCKGVFLEPRYKANWGPTCPFCGCELEQYEL